MIRTIKNSLYKILFKKECNFDSSYSNLKGNKHIIVFTYKTISYRFMALVVLCIQTYKYFYLYE